MSRKRARKGRRVSAQLGLPTVLAAMALAVAAPPALAYWNATGSGQGEAYVTTLLTPTLTVTAAPEAAELSWSDVKPPEGSAAEVLYYVKRGSGAPSAGCPGERSPAHVLSCTDTGLAVGSTYSYTVVARWRSWAGVSEARTITITSSPVTHFLLEAARTTVAAGEGDALTVVAKDANGRTVTSYTGSHTLTFEGASAAPSGTEPTVTSATGAPVRFTQPTAISFQAGTATVAGQANGLMTLYRAGNAQITASQGSIGSGEGLAIRVEPGPFKSFDVATIPGEPEAGNPFFLVWLTALDEWHNTITGYTRTRPLRFEGAESSPSGQAPEYPANAEPGFFFGQTILWGFKLYKAGTTTLRVSEEGTGHAGTGTFTVKAGQAKSLRLSALAPAEPEAGQALTLTMTALDPWGNVANRYGGSAGEAKTISYSGPEAAPSGRAPEYPASATTVTFKEGVATASGITLFRAAPTTLTAHEGTLEGSASLTVKPGPFRSFGVAPLTAEPQAGVAFEAKLTAWDEWQNTITTYARTGLLRYAGAEPSPSGKAPEYPTSTAPTFSAGQTTVAGFKLYRAGKTTLTVTEEGPGHAGSATFTVKPEPAASLTTATGHFAWERASATAGTLSVPCLFTCEDSAFAPNSTFKAHVAVADQYGNVVENLGAGHTVRVENSGRGTVTGGELAIPATGAAESAGEFQFATPSHGGGNATVSAHAIAGLAYNQAQARLHF